MFGCIAYRSLSQAHRPCRTRAVYTLAASTGWRCGPARAADVYPLMLPLRALDGVERLLHPQPVRERARRACAGQNPVHPFLGEANERRDERMYIRRRVHLRDAAAEEM